MSAVTIVELRAIFVSVSVGEFVLDSDLSFCFWSIFNRSSSFVGKASAVAATSRVVVLVGSRADSLLMSKSPQDSLSCVAVVPTFSDRWPGFVSRVLVDACVLAEEFGSVAALLLGSIFMAGILPFDFAGGVDFLTAAMSGFLLSTSSNKLPKPSLDSEVSGTVLPIGSFNKTGALSAMMLKAASRILSDTSGFLSWSAGFAPRRIFVSTSCGDPSAQFLNTIVDGEKQPQRGTIARTIFARCNNIILKIAIVV